jgi:hypothetical protein
MRGESRLSMFGSSCDPINPKPQMRPATNSRSRDRSTGSSRQRLTSTRDGFGTARRVTLQYDFMTIRGVVTTIFGLLATGFLIALTENCKELLKKWHGNTLFVRGWDKLVAIEWQNALRWERMKGL